MKPVRCPMLLVLLANTLSFGTPCWLRGGLSEGDASARRIDWLCGLVSEKLGERERNLMQNVSRPSYVKLFMHPRGVTPTPRGGSPIRFGPGAMASADGASTHCRTISPL
eukprot:3707289-Pyramimonas_sp.AAC.1